MPLDCDKVDACAAKLDALSKRFDNYVRVRKDADKSPNQTERAHAIATKHGWTGGGTSENNSATHPKHPGHSLHYGKSFSRNLAWNHRTNLDKPDEKFVGGGLGIGSFEKHLSKFHGG